MLWIRHVCTCNSPRTAHWHLVKRILWYLRETIDHGLVILASPSTNLKAYFDEDCGGCPDTRRLTCTMFTLETLSSRGHPSSSRWCHGLVPRRNTKAWWMQLQNAVGCATYYGSYTSESTKRRWSTATTSRGGVSVWEHSSPSPYQAHWAGHTLCQRKGCPWSI